MTGKKIVSMLLAGSMLFSLPGAGTKARAAGVEEQVLYTSASDWAKPEIAGAYDAGLIPAGLLGRQAPLPATREELCELAVGLYEKVAGSEASPISPNPFADTANPAILKAYALGITTGTSADTFSPDEVTNREQVATMFSRTIRVLFPSGAYDTEGAPAFLDQADISAWALEHVLYMGKAGILKGAEGRFMPRALTEAQRAAGYGTTTREQAVAIAVRICAAQSGTVGPADEVGRRHFAESLLRAPLPKATEAEKLAAIDFDHRVFRPLYDPPLALSLGGEPGAAAPWSTVIPASGGGVQRFDLHLSAAALARAKKLVWQVSGLPFDGAPVDSADAKPPGLLLSGELPVAATQFSVDFSAALAAAKALTAPAVRPAGLMPALRPGGLTLPALALRTLLGSYGQQRAAAPRTFYVRAYAVDAAGAGIGDAGAGLPVVYGDALEAKKGTLWALPAAKPFSLKLAERPGEVTYGKEFNNSFVDQAERALDSNAASKLYAVLPAGFPDDLQELRLQVSLVDYAAADSWRNVPGLVCEASLFPESADFDRLLGGAPHGFAIDFSAFVPDDSALPGQAIPYYIRAVALRDSAQAGAVEAAYSRTVVVHYGKPQASSVQFFEHIALSPPIPTIERVSYVPVQWEAENWQYHYVVTRQPTEKEVFLGFGADRPYAPYAVGTKLDFTPPPPEDKSWWEEAVEAIKGFFKSLADFAAKLVNWVSKAYADLKSGLINLVVSALPDALQGPLRVALTALVDYGLASIGIPPTLPNFDQLADLGVGYLAAVAMQQAGVPADSLTAYGLEELTDKVGDGLRESAKRASPNPMNWTFIKLDPEDLYRPAHLLVELYNPYDFATPKGSLSLTVDKFMDLSQNGVNPAVTRLYAAYGSSYVCLYKPVFGLEVPAMEPGQRLTVPIVLEEYVGLPFPGCSAPVAGSDYGHLYGGLGAFNFNLFIQYDLPPITQEAARQGYAKEAIYSYSALGSGRSFSVQPGQAYGG
ncbi:MAG: S-layer homology domain-containing protein [Clostridiales bacterium]|nr:S-layer homology domain-containing protein [Clostridiales bacterium]